MINFRYSVMPDFMSGIHDLKTCLLIKVVDARDKRGHDVVAAYMLASKTK